MLQRDSNSGVPSQKADPARPASAVRPVHDNLRIRLREREASRATRQLSYIVCFLYPRELCERRVSGDYPQPTLRARIPTIAAACGLNTRVTLQRLTTLETEGLVALGEDPLAPRRRAVWLTSAGQQLATELHAPLPNLYQSRG